MMSYQPIQGMRVSSSMQTRMLLEQMRTNTLQLFSGQQQLATGLRLQVPSDDPAAAAQALRLSDVLERYNQLQRNVQYADRFNAATEAALTEVRDALNEARDIASDNAGSLVTSEEREAAAAVVDGLIQQVLAVANRQHEGTYLFAGQQLDRPPFLETSGGVLYQGDTNDLRFNLDDNNTVAVGLRGDQVFGAISAEVRGWTPLTPRVDATTRLADLFGTTGEGIRRGSIVIDEAGGAGAFAVDLAAASTLGDVVGAINNAAAAAGATISASLTTYGIQLTDGAGLSFRVLEQGDGKTASDLGIARTAASTLPLAGQSVRPKLTGHTPVSWLRGGAGINTGSTLLLTNAGKTVNVDLSGAATLQDILNTFEATGLGVSAQINDAQTGIDVLSALSGSRLSIAENNGTLATSLGVLSFLSSTPLSALNDGQGVSTVNGTDLCITARNGDTFEVDLDGCQTIGDVIGAINTAAGLAGVAVSAGTAAIGNGIRLLDATGGTDPLQVERANLSPAAGDLGLLKKVDADELIGDDVHTIAPQGIFSALADLRAALQANDTAGITRQGDRLGDLLSDLGGWQGRAGALGRTVASQKTRLEDAALSTKSLLSDVRDADYTEVVMRFTQAQTALQANLMTGSKLMQLSLLDFLG